MVAVYVNGQQVGTTNVPVDVLARLGSGTLEFRGDDGKPIKRLVAEPICPWDPTIDEAEIERRSSKGGRSLAEFWKSKGVE
jgi:hypothetical protein